MGGAILRVTAVTTSQAIILGMMPALTPSVLLLMWVLWRDGKLSLHRGQPEIMPCCRFDHTASDLRDLAERINDSPTSQRELAARLRLTESCRLVLVMVGFNVEMHRAPVIIADDEEGEAPLAP